MKKLKPWRPRRPLEELSKPITKLAEAWSQNKRAAGQTLFHEIIAHLEPAARSLAFRYPSHSTHDIVNSAYVNLSGKESQAFESRQHFIGWYVQAMKYYVMDELKKARAQKREGLPITLDYDTMANTPENIRETFMVAIDALNRLKKAGLINDVQSDLFFGNRLCGVRQKDLAKTHGVSQSKVSKDVLFVAALLAKELFSEVSPDES